MITLNLTDDEADTLFNILTAELETDESAKNRMWHDHLVGILEKIDQAGG